MARQKEVGANRAIIDELTGHEGQGTSEKVYKKQMPLSVLHEAISKVTWPEVEDLLIPEAESA